MPAVKPVAPANQLEVVRHLDRLTLMVFILSEEPVNHKNNSDDNDNDDDAMIFGSVERKPWVSLVRQPGVRTDMGSRDSVTVCLLMCLVFWSGCEGQTIGEECEEDFDCRDIINAVCNETSETCTCQETDVPSSDGTMCLALAKRFGDTCQIPEQCRDLPMSKCWENKCVVAGASIDTTPASEKFPGECNSDLDCSPNECKNGICITRPVDLNIIGRPCGDDSECDIDGSLCDNGKCLCEDDFVPSDNLKSCLPKAKALGDECIQSIQCLAVNGICSDYKCSTILLMNKRPEVKKVPLLGDACMMNDDCNGIGNAICKERICECTDDYVTSVSAESCLVKAANEGEPCEIDKQCEDVRGTTCSRNKCQKLQNFGRNLAGESNGVSGCHVTSMKVLLGAAILFLNLALV